MADDFDALAASLRADPRDPITIQALADWLEEKGAAPESVRALTVEGPTVLVLAIPEDSSEVRYAGFQRGWKELCQWLQERTGHPIMSSVMVGNYPIRAIKATVREAT